MKTLTEQKLETGKNSQELLDKIISLIKRGWTPIGNVDVLSETQEDKSISKVYKQVLIRRKPGIQ